MGSGKDTVYARLAELHADFPVRRLSFADRLKQSAAALLNVDVDTLDNWKRNDAVWLEVCEQHAGGMVSIRVQQSIREFLQRYGTESHRDVFGTNFWIDQAIEQAEDENALYVVTDVRFANEAEAILERGGVMAQIYGPDEDTGSHASEQPLPASLITTVIDNTVRDDSYTQLDEQLLALSAQYFQVSV